MGEIVARLKLLQRVDRRGEERSVLREKVWRKGLAVGGTGRSLGSTDSYRIVCGFRELSSKKWCSGELGYAYPYGVISEPDLEFGTALRAAGSPQPRRGEWFAYYRFGYQQVEDGRYHLFRRPKKPDPRGWRTDAGGRPIGRRPVPDGMGNPWTAQANRRGVIGLFPLLPAIIDCPLCGRANRVDSPPRLRGPDAAPGAAASGWPEDRWPGGT
jgi:hypothetical protein